MKTEMNDVRVYGSDDYAGLESGKFAFYFGYEKTLCPHHGKDDPCECDEREWCFVVTHKEEEVARFPKSALDETVDGKLYEEEPYSFLLAGIGRYLND